MDRKIKTIIRKREGVVFEGDVFAVSSTNEIGPFDILADHANFVAQIKEKVTVHHDPHTKKDFVIDSGIISVKENLVEIFLGI